MLKNIVVLGAGLVGKAIAKDLAQKFSVKAVDISSHRLSKLEGIQNLAIKEADLSDKEELLRQISDADLVVGALPGYMGFSTAKTVLEAKKDIVDISFFREDPFELDTLARNNNVMLVTDCGVAPGMGNIILGYHHQQIKVENYECYVGGLPFKREWPFEYKAVFSPIDVMEEYIRPARYIKNKQLVTREALSETEMMEFDEIGTLEAWNSDGLRTLLKTVKIPNMIEKTLRYPGTVEYLKVLRDSGFFSYKEELVGGHKIRPIDLTAKLLFPKWELKAGERDFTIMRVLISGEKQGKPVSYEYNLFDEYDVATKTTSMARTTGFTCTAAVNLVAEGMFKRKGVCPPEYLGEKEENFRYMLNYLKERGVDYRCSEK